MSRRAGAGFARARGGAGEGESPSAVRPIASEPVRSDDGLPPSSPGGELSPPDIFSARPGLARQE